MKKIGVALSFCSLAMIGCASGPENSSNIETGESLIAPEVLDEEVLDQPDEPDELEALADPEDLTDPEDPAGPEKTRSSLSRFEFIGLSLGMSYEEFQALGIPPRSIETSVAHRPEPEGEGYQFPARFYGLPAECKVRFVDDQGLSSIICLNIEILDKDTHFEFQDFFLEHFREEYGPETWDNHHPNGGSIWKWEDEGGRLRLFSHQKDPVRSYAPQGRSTLEISIQTNDYVQWQEEAEADRLRRYQP